MIFRSRILRTIPALLLLIIMMLAGTASAEDNFCTRANLKKLAGKYFDALAAHDPSMMPFAPNVKYTENGVVTKIGDGIWKTAGKALLTRSIIDTFRCGTHTQAVLEEKNAEGKFRPILFGVRLQYKNEKITEVESIIAREKEFAMTMSPEGGANSVLKTKDQDWEGILPIAERSSRLAMIAAADDYFNMFTKEPIHGTPFAKPCNRWENGFQTTKGGSFGGKVYVAGDCSPKGLVISNHGPRRFLVDVEEGAVVAYVHFAGSLPDFHMFKMINGKVKFIQAVIGAPSKSMGWPAESICKDF